MLLTSPLDPPLERLAIDTGRFFIAYAVLDEPEVQ